MRILRASLLGLDFGVLHYYYRLFYKPRSGMLEEFIWKFAKNKGSLYFMQIGGNEGLVSDPIFKLIKQLPWKGIIVEPQWDVFHSQLKRTYRFEKKVILENVAIAREEGFRTIYKLNFSDSRWATGLATFDKKD